MERRDFLKLSLGAPIAAQVAISGGLGVIATANNLRAGVLQSLWRWNARFPDRLLCIPHTVFESLWDHLHGVRQLYGDIILAKNGWDHLFFSGRPVIPYWSKDDLQHTAKEIHDISGKWIVAIDDSQL